MKGFSLRSVLLGFGLGLVCASVIFSILFTGDNGGSDNRVSTWDVPDKTVVLPGDGGDRLTDSGSMPGGGLFLTAENVILLDGDTPLALNDVEKTELNLQMAALARENAGILEEAKNNRNDPAARSGRVAAQSAAVSALSTTPPAAAATSAATTAKATDNAATAATSAATTIQPATTATTIAAAPPAATTSAATTTTPPATTMSTTSFATTATTPPATTTSTTTATTPPATTTSSTTTTTPPTTTTTTTTPPATTTTTTTTPSTPDTSISLTINMGDTATIVARKLYDLGLISDTDRFLDRLRERKLTGELLIGKYRLYPDMEIDALIDTIRVHK